MYWLKIFGLIFLYIFCWNIFLSDKHNELCSETHVDFYINVHINYPVLNQIEIYRQLFRDPGYNV
jgi:hypothetical protein